MDKLTCKICQVTFEDQRRVMLHVKKHHPENESYEKYVLKYFFNDIVPTCKCGCGTVMKFFSFEPTFYNDFTKNHFPRNPHTEESKQKIREGIVNTMQERYGVDNAMDIPENIQKIADTKLERYGDEYYNNMEKQYQTFIDRYGDPKYRNTEQMIETNLERYGVRMFTQLPEGKQKIKDTKRERYGDENYTNLEKANQTKLKRYGYKSEFENPEYRKKYNGKTSLVESFVCDKLRAIPKFMYGGKEFDMILGNYVIEVDGDWWHPNNLSNIYISQISTITNDYLKMLSLSNSEYTLIRIKSSKIGKVKSRKHITFDYILQNQYHQNFDIDLDTVIIGHQTIIDAIDKYGIAKAQLKLENLYKFTLTFYPLCERSNTFDILNVDLNVLKSSIITTYNTGDFTFNRLIDQINLQNTK